MSLSCRGFRSAQQVCSDEAELSQLSDSGSCRILFRRNAYLRRTGSGAGQHFSGRYQPGILSRPLCLHKQMCRGSGLEWTSGPKGKGYSFFQPHLWKFHGSRFRGRSIRSASQNRPRIFVKKVPQGEIVVLPKVGHGFSVPKNWMPQFKKAFSDICRGKRRGRLPRLHPMEDSSPCRIFRLLRSPRPAGTQLMGVIITGDGGWGVTDRGIAEVWPPRESLCGPELPPLLLEEKNPRTNGGRPESNSAALQRPMEANRSCRYRIFFRGGCSALYAEPHPGRKPAENQGFSLLGLSSTADFQFHLTDWFASRKRSTSQMVRPGGRKIAWQKNILFLWNRRRDALCGQLDRVW